MRLSATLSRYITRQFLASIGLVFAVLLGLVFLIDSVELLRRTGNRTASGMATISATKKVSLNGVNSGDATAVAIIFWPGSTSTSGLETI